MKQREPMRSASVAFFLVILQLLGPSIVEGSRADAAYWDGNTLSQSIVFNPAVSYNSGGYSTEAVAAGDLNGDGKTDIVLANYRCKGRACVDGSVSVLLGNSDGSFQAANNYDSGAIDAMSLALGDLNGDGRLDVVVADECLSTTDCRGFIGVLLGNGDGTFQKPVLYYSGGYEALSLKVADVNGDGRPDLLVANSCTQDSSCSSGGGVVGVLLGNGDGTFQPASSFATGGNGATSLAVGDINADGKPDVVVTNSCPTNGCTSGIGVVGVLLGNGDGTFLSPALYSSGGYKANSVTIADFNGDGNLDIAVLNNCADSSCSTTGTVAVLIGSGDGTFLSGLAYGSSGYLASSIASGDVNGDGKPDLLITNDCASTSGCAGVVAVFIGNGDGSFQSPTVYGSGGRDATSVALADVNADGFQDILVLNSSGSTSSGIGSLGILSGTVMQVSPVKLVFGKVVVGTKSAPKRVTITNLGIVGVSINSITLSGSNPSDFSLISRCGKTLAPGSSCFVSVSFAPTVTGQRTAAVSVSDSGGGSPQTVALSGTGQ